jgi:hypothetical protein
MAKENILTFALMVEVHSLEPAVDSGTGEYDEGIRWPDRFVHNKVSTRSWTREGHEENGYNQAQQDQPHSDRSCAFQTACHGMRERRERGEANGPRRGRR